jgi:hypothetical protein
MEYRKDNQPPETFQFGITVLLLAVDAIGFDAKRTI